MDKKALEQWLQEIVDEQKKLVNMASFNDTIQTVNPVSAVSEVHLYRGIYQVAECLGENVRSAERGDDTYPILLWFCHNGIKVFQLSRSEKEV